MLLSFCCPDATVDPCRISAVVKSPASAELSLVITCIGAALVNSSLRMREPVTTTYSIRRTGVLDASSACADSSSAAKISAPGDSNKEAAKIFLNIAIGFIGPPPHSAFIYTAATLATHI